MATFDRFDIAEAHYLFARHYHRGGDTYRRDFARLHRMEFHPGLSLRTHDDPDQALTENGAEIYRELVERWKAAGEKRDGYRTRPYQDRIILRPEAGPYCHKCRRLPPDYRTDAGHLINDKATGATILEPHYNSDYQVYCHECPIDAPVLLRKDAMLHGSPEFGALWHCNEHADCQTTCRKDHGKWCDQDCPVIRARTGAFTDARR